ncbi:MAG: S-methyl-5-thioribose-1-phosphate isomerase [Candidatus Omnitrophica bacterium]|nr:S-methyl-5-thioribose-1-phosphate isomerase [Candidatus Omnitrophota bacterium]
MSFKTIEYKYGKIKIIDQSKLPDKLEYLYISNIKDLRQAIRRLSVRGAPALGACAELGVYLGIRDFKGNDYGSFIRKLKKVSGYLASSRPTARNLFWGIERVSNIAFKNKGLSVGTIKALILEEALNIINEDKESCRNIGRYGASLIKNNDGILTICNAGILATCGYGTVLGVLYRAKEKGKIFKVYISETRPLLQGARLSAWELKKKGIDALVICDNTAAALMQQGKVSLVIAGADRVALNGDTANKIGTYNLAILCKYHNIPFYIAAPASTFDLSLRSGKDIIVEEREPKEVSTLLFKREISPKGIKVMNPAFDVTGHRLITAIITDYGIIRSPLDKNIRKILC